jgi:hypothetical protein
VLWLARLSLAPGESDVGCCFPSLGSVYPHVTGQGGLFSSDLRSAVSDTTIMEEEDLQMDRTGCQSPTPASH